MPDSQSLTAVFDGSFDGFLTVVFNHYYEGFCPHNLVCEDNFQQALDAEFVYVKTDYEKAKRVFDGIGNKISEESAQRVYRAFLADYDDARFTSMYVYTLLGFKMGKAVEGYLQNNHVATVCRLSRQVMGEAHSFLGFSRFAETKSGVYYSAIDPKNNVLPMVAEHFADRLRVLQWIIHDTKRGLAAVFDGERLEIREAGIKARIEYSIEEDAYQELWMAFFNTITIEGRRNKKLQQANMPKRYRHYAAEWRKSKLAYEGK